LVDPLATPALAKRTTRIVSVAKRTSLATGLALAVATAAFPVHAKSSYTVTVGTMDLGVVVPASSGDTQFRINNSSGTTSVISGTGARASANDARALVTVTCNSVSPVKKGDCPTSGSLQMTAAYLGGASGRVEKLAALTVYKGTGDILSGPTGTGTISFAITPPGSGSGNAVTFYVAGDFYVWGDNSGKAFGDGTASFVVTEVGTGAAGVGTAHLRADRKLTISSDNSGMIFGAVTLPKSASGTVELTANASPSLVVTGGVTAVPGGTLQAAHFTVKGEGGQAVTVHVPSFTVSGPGTITITPETDLTSSPALGGAINSQGTLPVYVGGAFTLYSNTPVGSYSGSVTVTADYN
jgi:hypothetical protein